jgi:hypothetical protein
LQRNGHTLLGLWRKWHGKDVGSGYVAERRRADIMDDQALTGRIDEALEQFRGRDLVAASEVMDLLLDLRLMLLAADEAARATTAS